MILKHREFKLSHHHTRIAYRAWNAKIRPSVSPPTFGTFILRKDKSGTTTANNANNNTELEPAWDDFSGDSNNVGRE